VGHLRDVPRFEDIISRGARLLGSVEQCEQGVRSFRILRWLFFVRRKRIR